MTRPRLQLRRGTAAEWAAVNPVLLEGEVGVETDTGQAKVGNGIDAWNDLPYIGTGGGGGSAHIIQEDGTDLPDKPRLNFAAGLVASDSTAATDVSADYGTSATTQAFGDSASAGTSQKLSRADHKHGFPSNPVPAHEAAADPHTQYLKEKASGGTAAEVPTHDHSGASEAGTISHASLTGVAADQHHAENHQTRHQAGGADALTGNLSAVARVGVAKNGGSTIGSRRRLNFIEGSNVTITVADDSANEEVDITIAAAGGSVSVEEDDTAKVSALSVLDFRKGLDVTESPSGEANIDVDEAELSHNLLGGRSDAGAHPHSALSGVTADQHHPQSHAHDGSDGSGTVAHSSLTGVSADQHHPKVHSQADHTGTGSTSTLAFGDSPSDGTGTMPANKDHKHGMPANPVPAHEAASDPHTQYLREKASGGVAAEVPEHTHASAAQAGGTLSPAILDLPSATNPTQTAEGRIVWDSDDDIITVGDGSATRQIPRLGSTTPTTQAFGDSASVGTSVEGARADHRHGMPADPVPSHEAASDPHTQYLKEKASGGTAAEVPTHNHSGASEAGTISHASLTGVTADQHHAQSHAHNGTDGSGTVAHSSLTGVSADQHHAENHQARHQAGGADALSGNLDANARVAVARNNTAVGTRRRINFLEGSNISLTVSDDAANEEVDVTIAAATSGDGYTEVVKTADENVASSTTFQNDDHLTFNGAANTFYLIEILVIYTSGSATPDIKVTVVGPTGAVGAFSAIATYSTSDAAQADVAFLLGSTTGVTAGTPASTAERRAIRILGWVRVGGTAGAITVQWAQNTSNATATTVVAGSRLRYRAV